MYSLFLHHSMNYIVYFSCSLDFSMFLYQLPTANNSSSFSLAYFITIILKSTLFACSTVTFYYFYRGVEFLIATVISAPTADITWKHSIRRPMMRSIVSIAEAWVPAWERMTQCCRDSLMSSMVKKICSSLY